MQNGDTKLKVVDCMSESPITVESGDALGVAVGKLFKWQIHELLVVDDGQLVGIVTDRDLTRIIHR